MFRRFSGITAEKPAGKIRGMPGKRVKKTENIFNTEQMY
jgi:hypothetical protein